LTQWLATSTSAAEDQLYHTQVSSLIVQHKPQFDEMVDTFYSSYHKWVPIVHRESLREYSNATRPDICRGHTALTLGMCLITRPLMDEGKAGSLRVSLYMALRRLLWDPESMAQPTLPLIQSSALLSIFEFGQGMTDAAYLTICTSLSMAQVFGLGNPTPGNLQVPLPAPGLCARQDEGSRIWWTTLIHERLFNALLKFLRFKLPFSCNWPSIIE
jgi:hypothetical protein